MEQITTDTILPRDIEVDFHRELGKGESSRVYRGRWMGVLVAVKRKKKLSLDALDRETDILRQMNHPHVVQFYGILYEKQCLVMEYFPGTLQDFLRKNNTWWKRYWCRSQRMSMVQDILSGLAYLHSLRIIHRDLKPSNILMTEHGRLKLGDFGLSEEQRRMEWVRCSDRRGTLYYMAPEVFFENPDYDERIDMWSFAVVLHDIYRTPPVFRVTERRHRFEYEITFPFKATTSFRAFVHLPRVVTALLKGCLRINPLSRITSREALLHLLESSPPFSKKKTSTRRAWFPICCG